MALWLAQDGYCAGCGNKVTLRRRKTPKNPLAPTFDHFVPASQGGSKALGNGLLKHKQCNEARADRPPTGCDRIWRNIVLARLETA